MDSVTVHIAEHMLPVYTLEKLEVHPYAENVQPQVCVTKPQPGLESEKADRLVFLAKNVLKRQQAHTSCPVHLLTCDVYYAVQSRCLN